MCAQALAVFNISKCVENGVEITPEFNLVGDTIVFVTRVAHIVVCLLTLERCSSHQAPFKCSIKPRSGEAERLIRQEFPFVEHAGAGRTE